MRSLRDATYRALRIEYEQLSEELGLDVERWSIAEPLLQAAIDPASVLVIVDGLIDIQLQSVPAEDQQVRLVARTVVDELAHVPPGVVAGLLSIAAGRGAPNVEGWLKAAYLYREGQLRRWASFMGHADVVDAVVTAFDERATQGRAEAKELKSAVKALSTKSRRLRIDLTEAPELGKVGTLVKTGQLDDADREIERLRRRIGESGATLEVRAYCAFYKSLVELSRKNSTAAGSHFREALRLFKDAKQLEVAAAISATFGFLLMSNSEGGDGERELRAAVAHFEQQNPTTPVYRVALMLLVLGLVGQNRFDEAEPFCRRWTHEERSTPEGPQLAWFGAQMMVQIHLKQARLDDAERELREHLAWRQATGRGTPEEYRELELLADILEMRGHRRESADAYRQAIATAQHNDADADTVARLEEKLVKLLPM